MVKRSQRLQRLILASMIIVFAGTLLGLGNPVIEEIADYGSAGLQSLDPCNGPFAWCCMR